MSTIKFEYLVISPPITDGKFYDGYDVEKGKTFFGNEKNIYKEKTITEEEWLNRKGAEGWELVNVLRNSMSYDIKEYYFKRIL